jgi:hypothetical protein
MRRTKWNATSRTTQSVIRLFRAAPECEKHGGRVLGAAQRGGVRLIYYFAPPDADFVAVDAKNEKENLSDSEKKVLAKILRPFQE